MAKESKGLTKVKEIYQDRPRRVKELKAEGRKVVGYLCTYPVLEMMTALDLVPYRVLGDMREPITKADACLPTMVCPFLRSSLDLALKDKYAFLDGMAMAHICDVGERMAHIWKTYRNYPYFYFMDVPHTVHKAAIEKFKEEIEGFKKSLESFTGKEISPEKLKKAIKIHNDQRTLVKELYDLRKPDPPLVSATEVLKVMLALESIPVEEGNELLREVIDEIKERQEGPQKQAARLLIWGSIIDDVSLIETIESAGANIVMDDICVGTRFYWPEVEPTQDPLDGLAYRYLVGIKCPRTCREIISDQPKEAYTVDLENRFGYLKDYIKGWNVNGVILQSVRYCDTHGYEIPAVRDYLNSLGLPNTYLEHDYSQGSLAPLRTRIQAFLEILG
jgi:bzd-type benzoyl-CoA reductase N subunit